MAREITPERVIAFTKAMVAISHCWPLPKTASRFELIRFKIVRFFLILNASCLSVSFVGTMYTSRTNAVGMANIISLTLANIQVVVQVIFCATKYNQLQQLVSELEEYLRNTVPWKRQVIQRYVNRYAMFYAVVMLWFYFNAILIIISPAVLGDQEYPTRVKYPFSIHSLLLKVIIYGHQSLGLLQCSAQVSVNGFIALLIFFSAARFVILIEELKGVTTIFQLKRRIQEHQHLLKYTNNVIDVSRPLVLCIAIVSFFTLVFNGVILIVPTPLKVKIEFLALCGTALMAVYMLARPGDHLMDISCQVAEGVYGSLWYDAPAEVRKILVGVLMRSQKPMAVAVTGILPPVCLKYFASYLSAAFSYFTTLRIVVVSNDEN
ncbi:hypothetical protein KM043_018413 [Ampulex compressa]|nr:hypothetical protein KM043_018413 [Ampulex compressa]